MEKFMKFFPKFFWPNDFSKKKFFFMKCLFFSDVVKVVNLQGKLKSNKKQASELFFDFPINNIGRLESEVETYKVG